MARFKFQKNIRAALKHFITHNQDAYLVVRAHALLRQDEGILCGEIANRLKTSRQSVYNWTQCFQQRQGLTLEPRFADAARSGRPATAKGIIYPLIDEVIDQDPLAIGKSSHGLDGRTSDGLITSRARHPRFIEQRPFGAGSSQRIRWKRLRHTVGLSKRTWRPTNGSLKRGLPTSLVP